VSGIRAVDGQIIAQERSGVDLLAVERLEEHRVGCGVNEVSQDKEHIRDALEPPGSNPSFLRSFLTCEQWECHCRSHQAADAHEPHYVHACVPVRLHEALRAQDEYEIEVGERKKAKNVNVEHWKWYAIHATKQDHNLKKSKELLGNNYHGVFPFHPSREECLV
jgi:hypothetical protein